MTDETIKEKSEMTVHRDRPTGADDGRADGGDNNEPNKKVFPLVFFRTKENIAGMLYGKIPKLSIACINSIFTVDNASPRSGILYMSYPANRATIDITVGIINLIRSLRLIRKYIFPALFTV